MLEDMRTMYNALNDFFGETEIKKIFGDYTQFLKADFLNVFEELDVNSKLGAKRVKDELEYFLKDLSG
jgi:hypothetical protein